MTSANVLDETLPLSRIVDLEAFREVCKSFSDLYGIGIKVFDVEGKKLADVRVSTGDHCGYLFSVHPTQVMCTSLVSSIKTRDLKNDTIERVECFSGLRYKIMPIVYEGSFLGRVIFGPYRPPELAAPPPTLAVHQGAGLDVAKLGSYLNDVPRATEEAVDKVLANIKNVLDIIIHNSTKTHLTSQMHIASISGAFADLEKANRSLKQANERLEELDRLKSNFIATVSHELRTPLTSVIGYSEMLLEGMAGVLNKEQKDYVGTILEKGESLLVLIGQILDLSRIESGNVIVKKVPTDIRDIFKLSLSDVLPQAKKRGVQLVSDVHPAVGEIKMDMDKIRRVVTNLLGNAVKFTPEGGTITLKADLTEDFPVGQQRFDVFEPDRNKYLRIVVADTGIGIPEDKVEQVFEAFFQVDNSSTREFGGTGLGLAIVRNFVQAHNGKISVTSEVGKGSVFTIKVPYLSDSPVEVVDGLSVRL